ncbi:MAG: helix-turn-helix transcriptional regulator [Bacilli bacterium]|nr:helix-turn-helix transcriptional regulator [Bacilli bacterium]NLN80377.1 helix-turn-helix transcriptional regulator [Erysipelotrichia bacterium]
MKETLGQRISKLRKSKDLTQEQLGQKVGVTSQAVSKWENDTSAPDIMLLVDLANIFEVSVDELLGNIKINETPIIVPLEERKNIDQLILRVNVDSKEGDKVRINLPLKLIKLLLSSGAKMPEINGSDVLSTIKWEEIFSLIEQGVVGKLVEIESSDGDQVNIVVE